MAKPLGERILEVLAEGGPRKPHILRAIAAHHRQEAQFDVVVAALKRARRIHILYRHGGAHYGLRPRLGST